MLKAMLHGLKKCFHKEISQTINVFSKSEKCLIKIKRYKEYFENSLIHYFNKTIFYIYDKNNRNR